jgi:hypothetical protein
MRASGQCALQYGRGVFRLFGIFYTAATFESIRTNLLTCSNRLDKWLDFGTFLTGDACNKTVFNLNMADWFSTEILENPEATVFVNLRVLV